VPNVCLLKPVFQPQKAAAKPCKRHLCSKLVSMNQELAQVRPRHPANDEASQSLVLTF
jgi:hypothetical protein